MTKTAKACVILFCLFSFISCITTGNTNIIPVYPNKLNQEGNRAGKCVVLYDKDGKVTKKQGDTEYYRIFTYRKGIPVAMVEYYASGELRSQFSAIDGKNNQINALWTIYYKTGERSLASKLFL